MARAFGDGGIYGGAAAGFVGSTQFGGHEMTEVWLKVLWISGTTSVHGKDYILAIWSKILRTNMANAAIRYQNMENKKVVCLIGDDS